MPKKITFQVISVTSEDEKYRSSELNDHGPTVKGWQSGPQPDFPQEILLKLDEPAVLVQVQILAHQYLIPSRIELYTTAVLPSADVKSNEFDYLGYVTLSDNTSSSYKSRELKSILLPTTSTSPSTHFKLSLHPPHANAFNPQGRVALVALQLLSRSEGTDDSALCPYDDLSFEMYVDREVALMVRRMYEKKEEAVKCERFRYAGRLKSAMEKLREVGERLGRLEIGKNAAIQAEDYTRANKKKEMIDELRKETYEVLKVNDLLEEDGIVETNDAPGSETPEPSPPPPSLLHPIGFPQPPPPPVESSSLTSPMHVPIYKPIIATPIRSGSLKRRPKVAAGTTLSAPKTTYEAYDERVIPQRVVKETTTTNINPVCLKMNERERKQAALPISVFGVNLVEKFYSRQYTDKEEGLKLLDNSLEELESTNKVFRAAVFLIHRALRDKVISVYTCAASLTVTIFTKRVGPRVTMAELTRSVEKLLPELLLKSGDPTPRVHNTAVHTILSLAHANDVRKLNIVPVHLTRPLTSSTHPRTALSKLEIVEQLILSLGISQDKNSGMTCRTLAELGASGLSHPNESVRKVSERVLILVYRVNPRLVRKQLPPDDDITRRNLLYRQLMQEFEKIDLETRRDGRAIKTSVSSYATSCLPDTTDILDTPNSLPGGNKQCIFCYQVCENFTEEGLNIHYWKFCPILTRCLHCSEVLEIKGLHRHLLKDCDFKELYAACPTCPTALTPHTLESHAAICTGDPRCPFCDVPIRDDDSAWRSHLTDGITCAKHPRRRYIDPKPEPEL